MATIGEWGEVARGRVSGGVGGEEGGVGSSEPRITCTATSAHRRTRVANFNLIMCTPRSEAPLSFEILYER